VTFAERVASHPVVFITGCLVWVPVAVWIIALIHWAISGEVDALVMVIGIGAAVALGYFTTNPPDPRLGPLLFTVVLGTVVVFPFARSAMNRHALMALESEQAERAYEVLRLSPNNIGARMKLARVLFVRGLAGHAVLLGETTLKGLPKQAFLDDFREVEQWKRRASDPRLYRDAMCLNCRTMNRAGEIYCKKCHAPILLDLLKGSWTKGGLGRKLVSAWILGIVAFVGIPSSALLGSKYVAIALIGIQVGLGFAVAFVGLRERKV
jgi:hypothetical protein